MMDKTWAFTRGRIEYRVFVRTWGSNPLRYLWHRLRGLWNGQWEFSTRTLSGSCRCYCPGGSTSDFRVGLLWCGVWLQVGRDWQPRPCVCDRTMAELFPGEPVE